MLWIDLLEARDKAYKDFAGAGSVELAQEDALPGPERNLTAFNGDDDAGAHEAGHEVAGAVSFKVGIVGLTAGDEPPQVGNHILSDRWIGILIDRNPGGGVGDEDKGKPILSILSPE